MSKLAKIKPNTKQLIAARSYMLKMLVEKVFTRRELIGKTKKARLYTAILNEKEKYITTNDNNNSNNRNNNKNKNTNNNNNKNDINE